MGLYLSSPYEGMRWGEHCYGKISKAQIAKYKNKDVYNILATLGCTQSPSLIQPPVVHYIHVDLIIPSIAFLVVKRDPFFPLSALEKLAASDLLFLSKTLHHSMQIPNWIIQPSKAAKEIHLI